MLVVRAVPCIREGCGSELPNRAKRREEQMIGSGAKAAAATENVAEVALSLDEGNGCFASSK